MLKNATVYLTFFSTGFLKEDTTIVQLDILDEQIGCIFSTVDQFTISILWLRNLLEVCLKGISISIMPLST